jgi:hypothetical protein
MFMQAFVTDFILFDGKEMLEVSVSVSFSLMEKEPIFLTFLIIFSLRGFCVNI